MNSNKTYIPNFGDLFMWCDEYYYCIESGSSCGVVNPVNEKYLIRNFYWRFDSEECVFVRKANEKELSELRELKNNILMVE